MTGLYFIPNEYNYALTLCLYILNYWLYWEAENYTISMVVMFNIYSLLFSYMIFMVISFVVGPNYIRWISLVYGLVGLNDLGLGILT